MEFISQYQSQIVTGLEILAGVIVLYLLCTPKNMLKISAWVIRLVLLRVRIIGKENLPCSGPVMLVSNHVSLLDLLVIQAVVRQKVRFMVRADIINFIPTRFIFRYLGVLCVPDARHPKKMKEFFEKVKNRLRDGETICFFPEGSVSGSGNLMRFRSGVEPFLPDDVQVTLIPVRLGMLHGRLTGIYNNRLRLRPLNNWPIDFSIAIGEPVNDNLTAFQWRQTISELGAIAERLPQPGERPLHTSFIYRAKLKPFATSFYDAATHTGINNFKMLTLVHILSKKIRAIDKGTDGYTGVLLPNMPVTAGVMLAVMSADRTPAVINFSAGIVVALESAARAGVKTVLTSRKFLQKLKWDQGLETLKNDPSIKFTIPEMICLEDLVPTITKMDKLKAIFLNIILPTRSLVRTIAPLTCFNMHHQAVLVFSSGSTGKPKAVMLTQRNINCNILAFLRVVDWTSSDRVAGNLPMFHSFGFTVCFALPASNGMPVAYSANPLDAEVIVNSIRDYKITILASTPTFLQMYMKKAKSEDFKSLRLCITGAEKLRTELAERYRKLTGKDIIEGFGCTELSPIVAVNLNNSIYTLGTKADHPGSIGCALPGIHVRIVNPETGVEVEPGQEGKMQVRAGSVMKGYLNEPELTAAAILNNYYDTGDIAKMDIDGYIYITGRASRFSKIGGEMVPHEGVEDAITNILPPADKREIAVTGRTDRQKGERLTVLYSAENLDIPAILAELKNKGLPNIWIPKADDFFKVDSLPMLGSGKLDLRQLKELVKKLENQ